MAFPIEKMIQALVAIQVQGLQTIGFIAQRDSRRSDIRSYFGVGCPAIGRFPPFSSPRFIGRRPLENL